MAWADKRNGDSGGTYQVLEGETDEGCVADEILRVTSEVEKKDRHGGTNEGYWTLKCKPLWSSHGRANGSYAGRSDAPEDMSGWKSTYCLLMVLSVLGRYSLPETEDEADHSLPLNPHCSSP